MTARCTKQKTRRSRGAYHKAAKPVVAPRGELLLCERCGAEYEAGGPWQSRRFCGGCREPSFHGTPSDPLYEPRPATDPSETIPGPACESCHSDCWRMDCRVNVYRLRVVRGEAIWCDGDRVSLDDV